MGTLPIDEVELAKSIKFAIKSTNDLNISNFGPGGGAALEGLAKELGRDLGRALAAKQGDGGVYGALASYWVESGLGHLEVLEGRPTLIRLSQCYLCHAHKDDNPRPTCSFKRTLLRSALEASVLNLEGVSEARCCRAGGVSCTFSVHLGRTGGLGQDTSVPGRHASGE